MKWKKKKKEREPHEYSYEDCEKILYILLKIYLVVLVLWGLTAIAQVVVTAFGIT